jgi:hypothetical protein
MLLFATKISRQLFLLPMLLLGCKAHLGSDASDLKVIGGTEASTGQFPASVHIPKCSATRIGPKHLLTAAHCVLREDAWELDDIYKVGGQFQIEYGVKLATATSYPVEVSRTSVHPSYKENAVYGGDKTSSQVVDVAVIEVLNLPDAIKIAEISDKILTPQDAIYFTGYGCEKLPDHMDFGSDTGGVVVKSDLSEYEKKLRLKFKEVPFHRYEGTSGIIKNVRDSPLLSEDEATKIFGGCPGDSGSAVYLADSSPFTKVVGINSYIGPFESAFMRLDQQSTIPLKACITQTVQNINSGQESGISRLCQ